MQRHYGMDWLRIGAFQLLILYHVGMAFVPWDFPVKVSRPIDWATIPMFLTNPWRLSLLFVVSGYASAALFAKEGRIASFLRSRAARLGMPLLFGIVVLAPPQAWVWVVTHAGYPHGFVAFVVRDYFRPQSLHGVIVPTWMHLWFVAYLLAYTLVLGAALALPGRMRQTLRRWLEGALAGPALLPLGVAWVYLARALLAPGWVETHALVDDWSAHAVYLPCFLFGYALAGSPALWAAIGRWWKLAGVLALAGWLTTGWAEVVWPGDSPAPPAMRPVLRLARATESWGAIIALLGLADAYWNRDGRWRATLAEAVFPFYLIHQTIIVAVGYGLLATPTGPLARFILLVAATWAGCWAFYLLGRRIGWLRPLIGLKPANGLARTAQAGSIPAPAGAGLPRRAAARG